jgi:chromosome segregation ATPase
MFPGLPMLSEEQIKKIISANESLQIQLADANAMLAAREQEIDYLSAELAESTALRSKLDGQLDEIESMRNSLGEKQQAAKGAEEREIELQQELTEMALLNKEYSELLQDYAYLQSQFKDIQARLSALQQRNVELEQLAGRLGELESRLENSLLERDGLKERISLLEAQKFLKEM